MEMFAAFTRKYYGFMFLEDEIDRNKIKRLSKEIEKEPY